MNAAVMVDLFDCLSEEEQIDAIEYVQSLAERSSKRRAEKLRRAFEEFDALLDGDTGWTSEEEMIADLAEFRRKNEGV